MRKRKGFGPAVEAPGQVLAWEYGVSRSRRPLTTVSLNETPVEHEYVARRLSRNVPRVNLSTLVLCIAVLARACAQARGGIKRLVLRTEGQFLPIVHWAVPRFGE